MSMAASSPEEIAHDKAVHFRGKARIQFDHLTFPNPIRGKDHKIIEELKRSLRRGCNDEEHPIPAIIDDDILQSTLSKSNLDSDSLRRVRVNGPPKLLFSKGVRLECLDGQHRILAAKEILDPGDKWWAIDLYGKNLGERARQSLRDGYSYSANYSDGEIFRHIRRCQLAGDAFGEQYWITRYSKPKERKLKLLLKRKILRKALDSILPVRGLWKAFHAGSLDFLMQQRIDEEIACHIEIIKKMFCTIFGGDAALLECTDESNVEAIKLRALLECTDAYSVEQIQLRAPAVSKYDSVFIQKKMMIERGGKGRLFPEIQDPSTRQGITSHLLAIEQPIHTLHSMLKNLRYLEPVVEGIKYLLPKPIKGTLREALWFHFRETGPLDIQTGENSYSAFSGDHDRIDLAIRQLFLYGIRRFATVPDRREYIYSVFGLAKLARKFGFSSDEIDSLLKSDPYQSMVLDLLRRALPMQKLADIHTRAQSLVRELRELVDGLSVIPMKQSTPRSTVPGLGEALSQRCGPPVWAPSDRDGDCEDANQIFLQQMHLPLAALQNGGEGISSFYIKRSIYLAFFGPLPGDAEVGALVGNAQQAETSHQHAVSRPASVEHGPIASEGSPGTLANQGESSVAPLTFTNKDSLFSGPTVTFIENGVIIGEVPFEKDHVKFQAREYASQGKKLSSPQGGYFVWEDCFNALNRTGSSTVLVSNHNQ